MAFYKPSMSPEERTRFIPHAVQPASLHDRRTPDRLLSRLSAHELRGAYLISSRVQLSHWTTISDDFPDWSLTEMDEGPAKPIMRTAFMPSIPMT